MALRRRVSIHKDRDRLSDSLADLNKAAELEPNDAWT